MNTRKWVNSNHIRTIENLNFFAISTSKITESVIIISNTVEWEFNHEIICDSDGRIKRDY
jgi:hypothetical protein